MLSSRKISLLDARVGRPLADIVRYWEKLIIINKNVHGNKFYFIH